MEQLPQQERQELEYKEPNEDQGNLKIFSEYFDIKFLSLKHLKVEEDCYLLSSLKYA